MNNTEFSNITDRIKRLERQNLMLKIIGFAALLFLAFNFGNDKNSIEQSEIKAQKFVLVNDQGKECGYLGYDTATKNPRLSLNSCYDGKREKIGLLIVNDSPTLVLNESGYPKVNLKADNNNGYGSLQLLGQNGNSHKSVSLYSGSLKIPPQFTLRGKEYGRIDIFGGTSYLKITDKNNKIRLKINKTNQDATQMRFFDSDGRTEIFEVPHK